MDFCPCRLPENPKEQEKLIDLFFDRENVYENQGLQRRNTLLLYMHLIQALSKSDNSDPVILDHHIFRSAVYTGYLPNEKEWIIPSILESTRKLWGIYQKNEILSLALQGLFWVALRMISEANSIYMSTEDFIDYFINSDVFLDSLDKKKSQSFTDAVEEIKSEIVALSDWENPDHEISISQEIVSLCKKQKGIGSYSKILKNSLNILMLLAARENEEEKPYGEFEFYDDYFNQYPINLNSFRKNINQKWLHMTLPQLMGWLANHWGIEAHLRIALRKLHRDKRNTFRVRPSENGLKIVEEPEPIFTSPRFRQGIQILRDIGIADQMDASKALELTPLGKMILEENIGN